MIFEDFKKLYDNKINLYFGSVWDVLNNDNNKQYEILYQNSLDSKNLFYQIINGHPDTLSQNLVYPDQKNELNATLLDIARFYNYKDTMKVLINKGSDVNVGYGSPLRYACTSQDLEMVRLLLKNGADPDPKNYQDPVFNKMTKTALYIALNLNDLNIVKELLGTNKVDLNYSDRGQQYLYKVIEDNNLEALKLLLIYNINVNSANKYLSYPIIDAVSRANINIKIVEKLIEYGVNVNVKNSKDTTALMMASSNNRLDIVKLLINNGADVNIINDENNTALSIAMLKNNQEIVQLLLQNGANNGIKRSFAYFLNTFLNK